MFPFLQDFRRALEFHVLQRLGFTRFNRSHIGGPISRHYSTVLNVNVTPTSTMTRSPSPFLAASLAPSFTPSQSPLPFRLFRPNRSSSSLVPNLSTVEIKSKLSSSERMFQIPLGEQRTRPLNSTFSWPPSLLSRSLVSHQSLLDSETSMSSLRRVRSAEPLAGIHFSPLKCVNTSSFINSPVSSADVTLLCCDSSDGGVYRPKTAGVHKQESSCITFSSCSPPDTGQLLSVAKQKSSKPTESLCNFCDSQSVIGEEEDGASREIEASAKNLLSRSKSYEILFPSCEKINQNTKMCFHKNKLDLGKHLYCLLSTSDSKLHSKIPFSPEKSNTDWDFIKRK